MNTATYTQEEMNLMADEYFATITPARSARQWLERLDGNLDEWVYPGLLCDTYTMFVGAPKSGKSQAAVEIAAAVTTGRSVLGISPARGNEPGNVLMITTEANGPQENLRRLGAAGYNKDRLWIDKMGHGGTIPEDSYLAAEAGNLDLVVVDHIAGVCAHRGVDLNKLEAVSAILSLTDRFVTAGVPVLFIHHANKTSAGDPVAVSSGSNSIAGIMRHIVGFRMPRNRAFTACSFNGNIEGGFTEPVKVTLSNDGRLRLVDGSQAPKKPTATDDAEAAMAEVAKELPGGMTKTGTYAAVAAEIARRGYRNNRGRPYSEESVKKKLNAMGTLVWQESKGFVEA